MNPQRITLERHAEFPTKQPCTSQGQYRFGSNISWLDKTSPKLVFVHLVFESHIGHSYFRSDGINLGWPPALLADVGYRKNFNSGPAHRDHIGHSLQIEFDKKWVWV